VRLRGKKKLLSLESVGLELSKRRACIRKIESLGREGQRSSANSHLSALLGDQKKKVWRFPFVMG